MVSESNENLRDWIKSVVPPFNKICPICGYNGKFEDYGTTKVRPNAKCPNCSSTERMRLLWIYLVQKSVCNDVLNVVHIMPEQAVRYKLNRKSNISYSIGGLDEIGSLLTGQSDCDIIIANNVLDRVPEIENTISTIEKSLAIGGIAILTVNLVDDSKEDISSIPRHFSKMYLDMISEYGLNAEKIDAFSVIDPALAYIFGIGGNDYLIVATKTE